MKIIIILSIFFISCSENKSDQPQTLENKKTITVKEPTLPETDRPAGTEPIVYFNKRFRNVKVVKVSGDTYRVTGEGQIFEASFGWVVEDGHNELQKGHEMTDAGAPEWGSFDFRITAKKTKPNTVLHLVLFETSAKDGSRQHELPIRLS